MSSNKPIIGRDKSKSGVQSLVIVRLDEGGNDPLGIVERYRSFGTDAFTLNRPIEPLKLAVSLGVIGRRPNVAHTGDPDEFLKISRDELRTVIADNPWLDAGK